jgi:hypothetical protein
VGYTEKNAKTWLFTSPSMLVEKILFITTDNPYLADLAILPFPLNGRENCYLGKMPILTKSPNRFIKRIYRFCKPNADLVFVHLEALRFKNF